MIRPGPFIAWSSLAVVGIGIAMHVVFQINLSSGRWVPLPPPAGFGMGGANDPMEACLDDLRAFCPEAQQLGRIVCLHESWDELKPACQAVFTGDEPPPGGAAPNER